MLRAMIIDSYRKLGYCVLLSCLLTGLAVGPGLAQVDVPRPTWGPPFLNNVFPTTNPNGLQTDWQIESAFPNLPVSQTVVITHNPVNGQMWVGSWDGLIQAFDNDPAVSTSSTVLDLRDRVVGPGGTLDGGLFGVALHPEFGQPDSPFRTFFYVYHASFCPLNDDRNTVDLTACKPDVPIDTRDRRDLEFFGVYLRLSRFSIPEGATEADKSSETVLFNIPYINEFHRGGGPTFGHDGHLYLAIGDQSTFVDSQSIDDNLNGGVLRLDVNVTVQEDRTWTCPAGSHLPRRTFQAHLADSNEGDDEAPQNVVSGQFYCIPDDNPWLDPTGEEHFEEYFALGLRNPHRITTDRLTGRIWVGDLGQRTREEVNIITKGSNYGWPFREGLADGPRAQPSTLIGVLTDPVIDIPQPEAQAIIGGYVYRGSRFPDLYGAYLAGDNVNGSIWAITLNENTLKATKILLTTWTDAAFGFSTWGEDLDGELYLGHARQDIPLVTLAQAMDTTPDPPALLSQTGAFADLPNLVPSAAWLPYDLNQPFWSDGAVKQRWISLPENQKIDFSLSDNWDYPVGTVFMKHFELPVDETNPTLTTRLETRFMVHGENGWYGVSYHWNEAQTDASLSTTSRTAVYSIATADGSSRNQIWTFPSRANCITCHNAAAGGALGARTHQMNGDFIYPQSGTAANQLIVWNQFDMFSPTLDPNKIPTFLQAAAQGDTNAPLEDRARSYLDSNCSYCHRPETGNRAAFDARLTTPLDEQNLLNGAVIDALGLTDAAIIRPGCTDCSVLFHRLSILGPAAMPPLAKNRVDTQGVALLKAWIESLESSE